jgi:hypothetical protein
VRRNRSGMLGHFAVGGAEQQYTQAVGQSSTFAQSDWVDWLDTELYGQSFLPRLVGTMLDGLPIEVIVEPLGRVLARAVDSAGDEFDDLRGDHAPSSHRSFLHCLSRFDDSPLLLALRRELQPVAMAHDRRTLIGMSVLLAPSERTAVSLWYLLGSVACWLDRQDWINLSSWKVEAPWLKLLPRDEPSRAFEYVTAALFNTTVEEPSQIVLPATGDVAAYLRMPVLLHDAFGPSVFSESNQFDDIWQRLAQ